MATSEKFKSQLDVNSVKIIRSRIPRKSVRFGCPLCATTFLRRSKLYEHCRRDHPQKMRLVECPYCPGAFSSKTRQKRHVNKFHSASANDNESAPSAKSTSTRRKNRSNRTKIFYASSSKFPCDYCHRVLSGFTSKMRHENMHVGERPFSCRYCPASFYNEYACTRHELECRRLDTVAVLWCKFCDFHVFDDTPVDEKLKRHYRRVHRFGFSSDAELNFLRREISDAKKNKKDVGGGEKTSPEYDATSSQANYNLEEIFRDHIAVSDENEPSVGEIEISPSNNEHEKPQNSKRDEDVGASSKNSPIEFFAGDESPKCEISPSNDERKVSQNSERDEDFVAASSNTSSIEVFEGDEFAKCEIKISQSNDERELPQNSERSEDVDASPENSSIDGFEGNESAKCKIEISQPNNEVGSIVRDYSDSNSNPIENAVVIPAENVMIKDDESSERNSQVSQPNVVIQDDILENAADAMIQENATIEIANKGERSDREAETPEMRKIFTVDLTLNSDDDEGSEPMTIVVDDDD